MYPVSHFFILSLSPEQQHTSYEANHFNFPRQDYGNITLPSSKSICNRALIINALAQAFSKPENLSDCDDTRVMIHALQEMPPVIDIGAAGTAMRFLTAFLSVHPGTHILTGTQRMQQRPIGLLVNALRHWEQTWNIAGTKAIHLCALRDRN